MPTTQQIRNWWAPACRGPFTKVALFGEGTVSVDGRIVRAVQALNACLQAHGYSTRKADTGAYNCRKITGGSGYSLHAYGIAIDINWQSNPYGKTLKTDMPGAMVAAIKAIRTMNGKQVWGWGGDYSGNKDAMHFEVVCSPADIVTGINPASVPGSAPLPPPPPAQPTGERDRWRRVQSLVGVTADGLPGPKTEAAINRNLIGWGKNLPGNKNRELVRYLQNQANRRFNNGMAEDGLLGPATNHVIVVQLGQRDGIAGPNAWRALLR